MMYNWAISPSLFIKLDFQLDFKTNIDLVILYFLDMAVKTDQVVTLHSDDDVHISTFTEK